MKLTPEQREQIRLSIIRHLDAAASLSFGISSALLLQQIRNEGYRQIDASDLAAEMEYLAGKKLIIGVAKTLSPENPHWKITSEGRDFFAQQ